MTNPVDPHMKKAQGDSRDEMNAALQTGNPAAEGEELELTPHQQAQVGMASSPSRPPEQNE